MARDRGKNVDNDPLRKPLGTYDVVANAPDPKRNAGRLIYLTAGGTGSVACVAISNGTNWKQIAVGANAI